MMYSYIAVTAVTFRRRARLYERKARDQANDWLDRQNAENAAKWYRSMYQDELRALLTCRGCYHP